ncbi:hypothetical protein QBC37DRAFT_403605 [Rhypophila decipiens]|uniref:Uncharacterized protein n=1 Tax=Rhypophila decipiens TaxID=261697 RepID=A0AAN6Y6B3_9PEZI|nr:hypothetical protein QBC37DRAFT_403605 [Rhypophila decipiens]
MAPTNIKIENSSEGIQISHSPDNINVTIIHNAGSDGTGTYNISAPAPEQTVTMTQLLPPSVSTAIPTTDIAIPQPTTESDGGADKAEDNGAWENLQAPLMGFGIAALIGLALGLVYILCILIYRCCCDRKRRA